MRFAVVGGGGGGGSAASSPASIPVLLALYLNIFALKIFEDYGKLMTNKTPLPSGLLSKLVHVSFQHVYAMREVLPGFSRL